MKKKNLFIIGIILILIIFLLIIPNLIKKEVCIENKKCFEVEISDTPELRSKGLSERDSLEKDKGMLFIFDPISSSNFWMKDMNFDLDMIGINDQNEITQIVNNANPCKKECPLFYFDNETKYVLEINAGLSEEYGFEKGDKLILKV